MMTSAVVPRMLAPMVIDWLALFSRVRRLLVRRGSTEEEAEDLVHDAWLRLERQQRGSTVQQPEAYLMRTAINLWIDARRAQRRRGQMLVLDDEVVLVDTAPSVEDVVLLRERTARLGACLATLDNRTRGIFLASRMDGMSHQQIAQRYRLSVSSVEKAVAKALLLLGSQMDGH